MIPRVSPVQPISKEPHKRGVLSTSTPTKGKSNTHSFQNILKETIKNDKS